MKTILASLLIFFALSLNAIHIRERLDSIPSNDLNSLRALFSRIIRDQGAYTLFGDKPVSLSGDFEITPWEHVLEGIPVGGVLWKKWAVWEEYKHLFPLKNYLLIKEMSRSKNFKISQIFLINKLEFIRVLAKHLHLFEQVLAQSIHPEKILEDLETRKISLLDFIDDNQMLLGILLGYGKYNSMLFNKREWEGLNDAGLQYSTIKLNAFGDYAYSPLTIESVHFSADLEHPETIALEKKYRELRGKISAIYAKGDFLEITLSQLISEDPTSIN